VTRSLASDHVTKMRRGQSTQRAFCSYVFRSRLRHYFFVSLTRWHRCHPESGLQAPDHAHVAESARWLQAPKNVVTRRQLDTFQTRTPNRQRCRIGLLGEFSKQLFDGLSERHDAKSPAAVCASASGRATMDW